MFARVVNDSRDYEIAATPFFATLSQNGSLDYPLFGLSLTRDSGGSLTFGGIDGSVVFNRSLIEWNEVVPFAPFVDSQSNTSSYLQWAVVLDGISVRWFSLFGTEPVPDELLDPQLTSSPYEHRSTGLR